MIKLFLLCESCSLPDAAGDESAQLLAAGSYPSQELLLDFPGFATALDVLLQRARVPIGRAAVVDEVEHGIVFSLGR